MKQKILNFLVLVVIKSFAYLPINLAQRIGFGIGLLLSRIPTSITRNAKINIGLCLPKLSEAKRAKLVRAVVKQTIITAAEMPAMYLKHPKSLLNGIKKRHGSDSVTDSFNRGKSVLLVGPHIGCWEIAVMYLSQNFPAAMLYTPPKIKIIDDLVYKARTRLGAKMSPPNSRGIKMLYRALKDKEMVAILSDQVPNNAGATFVPFYNIPAWTMTLPSRLYEKFDPDVYFVFCVRLGVGKGYELFLEPMQPYLNAQQDSDDKNDKFAHAMMKGFENIIDRYPDQYQWSYKRFKHTPSGVDYYKK